MFNVPYTSFIDGDFFESFKKYPKILYSDIDNLNEYIKNNILFEHKYNTLITHNGDKNIYSRDIELVFSKGSSIKRWYGQNITMPYNNLYCIPIGLERLKWSTKFNKQDLLRSFMNSSKNPSKLVYANFSLNTSFNKRIECYNKISNKAFLTNDVNKFVNINDRGYYERYYEKVLDHYFIVCPEGNGIDTHRFWETLYLGRIPIVLKNAVNESFSDLPILLLDKWEDMSKSVLINYINLFKAGIIEYNIEQLSTDYWVNKILHNI